MRWLWLRSWLAAGGFCLLYAAACTEEASEPPLEVAEVSAAVIGGEPVDSCAWPTTIGVNAWGSCTGTLIHPRVITTAAHCLTGSTALIFFGSSRTAPGAFSLIGRCRAGAQNGLGIGTSRDWGYCVLPQDERVERLPITPPIGGCEAERYLKPGMPAWVVGFGTSSESDRASAGIKRQVQVKVNAIDRFGPGTIEIGDGAKGACYGDSGGPVFMRVGDDKHDYGYRVLGSTTSGSSPLCNCNCSAVFVNIGIHVREIEANEGIDVTPCTDAEGRWNASESCRQFPSAPNLGSGPFPLCQLTRTRETIQSCAAEVVAPAAAGSGGSGGTAPAAGSGVLGTTAAPSPAAGIAAIRDAIARGTAILRSLTAGGAAPRPAAGSGRNPPGVIAGAASPAAPPIDTPPAADRVASQASSGSAGSDATRTQPEALPGSPQPGLEVPPIPPNAHPGACQLGASASPLQGLWFALVAAVLFVRRRFKAGTTTRRR